jgi:hypothetical protein
LVLAVVEDNGQVLVGTRVGIVFFLLLLPLAVVVAPMVETMVLETQPMVVLVLVLVTFYLRELAYLGRDTLVELEDMSQVGTLEVEVAVQVQ